MADSGILTELQKDAEVDLSQVDWNKLTPEEFRMINEKLVSNQKAVKKQERKENRASGYTSVSIQGKIYQIKTVDFQRLKAMKSEKSKQKLIEKIISEYNPIESL